MRTNLFPNPRNMAADSIQSWGQWSSIGTAPTIANSTAQWLSPVQSSVLVTWANPTSAAGSNVGMTVPGLTVGTTYTASAWVYVPTGSPAVGLNAYFNTAGSTSTTNDAWEQLSVTFTASSTSQFVGVVNAAAVAAASTYVYISQPLVEEGTTVGSYLDGGYLSAFWNADGTSTLANQVPQRINHCLNPSFEFGLTGWLAGYGTGGAGTFAIDSTLAHSGGYSAKMTWTTASTGGISNASYDVAAQGAVPGAPYTWSGWVYPSVDVTMQTLAYYYSGGGARLGAIYGDSALCPAHAWTRISGSMVAPAGTAYIRGFFTTHDALAAGTSINFDDALLEQTDQLLPYFDYNSANSAQIGSTNVAMPGSGFSPNSCSMSQSMPELNPNLPELVVQAWPTKRPYGVAAPTPMSGSNDSASVPSIAPLVLSDRTVQVTTSRGRQYELDTDQTGNLGLKLDNSDGAVSSLLKPYNNVKVSASWQGVIYDLWTGFASVVPSQSESARNAWSQLVGVDALDVLANRALRPIQQEAILASNPERFFPLDDAAGSQSARELTQTSLPGSGVPAPLTHYVEDSTGALGAGSCVSTFGAQSIAKNGASAWSLSNLWVANGANPFGAQIQVTGPDNQTGYTLDLSKAWAMEITASVSAQSGKAPETTFFSAHTLNNYGGEMLRCMIAPVSGSTTESQVILFGPSASPNYIYGNPISAATVAAGLHIVVAYDGNGVMSLIVNGVLSSFVGTAASWHFGIAPWIGIGASYDYSVLQTVTQDATTVTTLQNFAIYGPQLGVPGSDTWADHYQAFLGYPYETAQTRIARVLSWSGCNDLLTWSDANDTRQLAAMQGTDGTSALSVIQTACQSVLSRFIANEHGSPLYQDKAHGLLDLSPVVTFGSDEANGEIPYTGMPTIAIDPQHIFNDVTVTQDSGNATRYADQDSMAQYFQRVLQVSSSLYHNSDASSLSSYLVGRYSEPPSRVSTLSVDLAANPSITAQVLGVQVGHHVKLNHRTQSGTVELDLTVDQVSHTISAESWMVNFELTPLYRYWIMAAGRSTMKTASAAGAKTLTINPMQDSAYNPVEATIPDAGPLAVGFPMVVSPGTPNEEVVYVASSTSDKPRAAGYSTATVTLVNPAVFPHAVGDVICDSPLAPTHGAVNVDSSSNLNTMPPMTVAGGNEFQSFVRNPANGEFYLSVTGSGSDCIITRNSASGAVLDQATLTGGGHGTNIGVEFDSTGAAWIWLQWGSADAPLMKWKYAPGTFASSAAVPVADFGAGSGTGRIICFSIDNDNDRIAVRTKWPTGTQNGDDVFELRKLSDYNAGVDNVLNTVRYNETTLGMGAFQGFSTQAGYFLYVASGGNGDVTPATLTQFQWGSTGVATATLDSSQVPARTGTLYAGGHLEAEGVQVVYDSSGTHVYFGVISGATGAYKNYIYSIDVNTYQIGDVEVDPTQWDEFSMVDSTTIPQW